MKKQIIHANIVLADRVLEDGVCCYENGMICYVGNQIQQDAEPFWTHRVHGFCPALLTSTVMVPPERISGIPTQPEWRKLPSIT